MKKEVMSSFWIPLGNSTFTGLSDSRARAPHELGGFSAAMRDRTRNPSITNPPLPFCKAWTYRDVATTKWLKTRAVILTRNCGSCRVPVRFSSNQFPLSLQISPSSLAGAKRARHWWVEARLRENTF